MENETKTELLHVRIDPQTREAIRLLALRTDRTEANLVRSILRREAQAAGILNAQPDQREAVTA